MASPAVTYTFSNSTTADAAQVNQNFTDLINSLTDGTKDLSISALTCAGTATLNGNVNIGNASGDDLTITASLASSVPLKATYSYDIGAATLGLKRLYLGSNDAAGRSVALRAGVVTSSYTMDLPAAAPAQNNSVMTFDTSGVGSFEPKSKNALTAVKTTTYTATAADDVILVSGASAAWTLSLPAAASNTGKRYYIKRTDDTPANAVTIDPNSSETIDGSTTLALYTKNECVEVVCDGSNWLILDHKCNTSFVTSVALTATGFGTIANTDFQTRREGDALRVRGSFQAGTCTNVVGKLTLPTGYTIDTSKGRAAATNRFGDGEVVITAVGPNSVWSNDRGLIYFGDGSSTTDIFITKQIGGNVYVKENVSGYIENSNTITFDMLIPITGWWV